jgi:hypothetical protein
MIVGIVLFALAMKNIVAHVGEELDSAEAFALCGASALYLLTYSAIRTRFARRLTLSRGPLRRGAGPRLFDRYSLRGFDARGRRRELQPAGSLVDVRSQSPVGIAEFHAPPDEDLSIPTSPVTTTTAAHPVWARHPICSSACTTIRRAESHHLCLRAPP